MIEYAFNASLERSGGKVILPLPFDPNQVWGEKDRHHIQGIIQGVSYRGEIRQDGATYYLVLGPAWLRDAHLEKEEDLEVSLSEEGPRTGNVAEDIGAALSASPRAQSFFESLPTFYRNNFMRWIESAKRPETRQAHIREMVRLLEAGKRER
jgi:hypothetical protein